MEITQVLMYIVLPIMSALVANFLRGIMLRLDKLESRTEHQVSDAEVRQLLDDKLSPLSEDLKYIRDKIEKFTDILINKNS